ncbi:MAG: DUF6512 family protein [Candidatus Thorarchaeota archaeon]
MDYTDKNYIFIRSGIYLVIFILLHYLFDWFPNVFTSLFSGINESVFQHMKIAFYAFILLSLIELIIFRNNLNDQKNFIYTHLISVLLIPLITLVLFFIGAMFYGERSYIIEIIYAIMITYLSGLSVSIIEQEIKDFKFSKRFKILLLVITAVLIAEFTVFTFNLPWHDVFANPYGP